jgi:Flp pilus assembly protein TadG
MIVQALLRRARSFQAGRLHDVVRAFLREEKGVTAVEFALIAAPFFGLILVTMQVALVLWCTQILEVAVASASRQIYTGQFQSSAASAGVTSAAALQTRFKKLVCDAALNSFDCTNAVSVDVRTYDSFTKTAAASPNNNGVYDTTSFGYQSVSGNGIVVVRATMQFPNYANMFAPATALKNGYQLIMASAAFRAEPF